MLRCRRGRHRRILPRCNHGLRWPIEPWPIEWCPWNQPNHWHNNYRIGKVRWWWRHIYSYLVALLQRQEPGLCGSIRILDSDNYEWRSSGNNPSKKLNVGLPHLHANLPVWRHDGAYLYTNSLNTQHTCTADLWRPLTTTNLQFIYDRLQRKRASVCNFRLSKRLMKMRQQYYPRGRPQATGDTKTRPNGLGIVRLRMLILLLLDYLFVL